MISVTRLATPSTAAITKLRLSFRLSALVEKLELVVPAVEQVTLSLRTFVSIPEWLSWIFIVGAPASEKHVTELIVMPPIRLTKMVFWLSAVVRRLQLSQPAR